MVAGFGRTPGPVRTLMLCGLAMCGAFVFSILLYANVPSGVDQSGGIHPLSAEFFDLVWHYPKASLSPSVFRIGLTLAIVVLWAGYIVALRTVMSLPEGTDNARFLGPILVFALVFNLLLMVFLPPVISSEVFQYAIQGSINAVHGFNPYVTSPNQVAGDPFLLLAPSPDQTTHYGPAWIQLASLCAWLGNGSIILTVYCFKLLAMVANIVGAFLVLAMSRRFTGGEGITPLLFYAWNPILLLASAGTAHNDATMMCLALLGLSLISHDRLFLGVAVLLVSAMINYLTLLLLIFVLVYVFARQGPLQRVQLLFRLALLSLMVVILFHSPFLSGIGHPSQLFAGLSAANPMRNYASEVTRYLISVILAIAGMDPARYVGLVLNGVFAVVLAVLASALRSPDATLADVSGRFGLAALVYTYFVYGGSLPWHLVGPFTILALAPATPTTFYVRLAAIGLGITSMVGTVV